MIWSRGGGALPALVGGVLIKYLSCVTLSHVCHLPFKIERAKAISSNENIKHDTRILYDISSSL